MPIDIGVERAGIKLIAGAQPLRWHLLGALIQRAVHLSAVAGGDDSGLSHPGLPGQFRRGFGEVAFWHSNPFAQIERRGGVIQAKSK